MRICIDFDGVICQLKQSDSDSYEHLKPMPGAVEKLTQLKKSGHYLIIYTARRMKTHQGNLGAVIADIGRITIDWLDKNQVPYDEIYFGKPWADIYIDDNAYRFQAWDEINDDASNLPSSSESRLTK
jgi:capsule biosynthesis phosphatase